MRSILSFLSSIWLSVSLLTLLAILTWLGTLEQVDSGLFEVQRKYFDSVFLVHQWGDIPIPLPGARLVMVVLCVNLVLGGIVRLRRGWATAGVLVTHLGILFLLFAGLVKAWYSYEGHVTLYEGEQANRFESYHDWEIALLEDLGGGRVREFSVPDARVREAAPGQPVRVSFPGVPFDLEVERYLVNSRVLPKGAAAAAALPAVDGYALESRPRSTKNESNTAGAYVALVDKQSGARTRGLLHGAAREPLGASFGGRRWAVELRRESYPLGFTLGMQKFLKEDHPRMDMAKAFSSDVSVVEGASTRPVRISMNQPLREGGLVLYQSSWGPADAPPGTPLFSTLAVVQNPADQYPLWACIVIALGLSLHFVRKLARHIRAEARPS